ncbi:hypothetical protein UNSWDHB_1653 [Dehalobacter sp. UNSWDHB]|nr:hypothetical protein DHBDCA_p2234 [Dehalobacter sp. DCA]EQB21029.1 hypothetical protein UNSWDHB_1653 [Dehalobacter sp. UNSWDHB]
MPILTLKKARGNLVFGFLFTETPPENNCCNDINDMKNCNKNPEINKGNDFFSANFNT